MTTVAFGQIPLSGYIYGTLEDTVYAVENYIYVAEEDSLTIEAGASLIFTGDYQLIIYGYLYAVGAEDDSIIFKCADSVEVWGTLVFEANCDDNSILSYAHLSGCRLGGINFYQCEVTLSHCTITGNSASWGGGLYISYSNPLISNCVIYDNYSVNNGGGIYCTHSSPTIIDCEIYDNSCNVGGGGSGQGGGGICANHDSSPLIIDCVIYNNQSYDKGGGIAISDVSNPIVERCLIYQNHAEHEGGGIFIGYANPSINRCTISNNSSSNQGGGMSISWGAEPAILHTIVEGNSGEGGVYFYGSTLASFSFCDFYDNEGGDFMGDTLPAGLGELNGVNVNGDSCDAFFNIYADPLFVDPGNANYQLSTASPCIDAGDPEGAPDPDGTIPDIGAFYFPQSNPLIYDLSIMVDSSRVVLLWGAIAEAEIYHVYRSAVPYFDISTMQPILSTNIAYYEEQVNIIEEIYYYVVTWE